jgi:hypothetical protein
LLFNRARNYKKKKGAGNNYGLMKILYPYMKTVVAQVTATLSDIVAMICISKPHILFVAIYLSMSISPKRRYASGLFISWVSLTFPGYDVRKRGSNFKPNSYVANEGRIVRFFFPWVKRRGRSVAA